VRCGPSGYLIEVNGAHHENRRRFTLAHEIAHFMMHRDQIGDGIEDGALYRSEGTSDHMERQANFQAAIMLMPAPLVRDAFAKHSRSPHILARDFKVSESAMRIRLKNCGSAPDPRFNLSQPRRPGWAGFFVS